MSNTSFKLAGVMGWPIGHSKSPRLHGYWLKKHKISGFYVPLSVHPIEIEKALHALPTLGFSGVNLTIPHKQLALPLMNKLDNTAAKVGAVNTVIVHEDGTFEGRNTDVFGFTENLRQDGFLRTGTKATVIGAGGAARAIVVGLTEMGFTDIHIINRSHDKAEAMVESLSLQATLYDFSNIDAALEDTDLLVNTTSLGMQGQPPLTISLAKLPPKTWVNDIVYAPLETDLLKQAKAKGNRTTDGLGMLLHQARPAFNAWFGQDPEVTEDLRRFVLEAA